MGRGDLGLEDVRSEDAGTRGRKDARTREHGDAGTRERGTRKQWNSGTRELGNSGTRGRDLQTTPVFCAEYL